MATTFERVRDVVVAQLKVSPDEVKPEADLVEDLRADSLDIVDLTIAIEEAFADDAQFEIRDEDAENIHTIQDILDFLKAQGLE
jgi:acyl carrier protein